MGIPLSSQLFLYSTKNTKPLDTGPASIHLADVRSIYQDSLGISQIMNIETITRIPSDAGISI